MSFNLLKANFLKHTSLTDDELNSINHYYEERQVDKGEYILRQGDICRFEGFVTKGCFEISTTDSQGNERILYFAAQDWWVMEIDSFISQTSSELDIKAIEPSRLLVITKTDKEKLYQEVPKAERLFRVMSQRAVVAWQRRLIRNHTMTAEERYFHFLKTYPEISQRITNKQIASYLGITQEFVSKIRKKNLSRGK
ncbi:MAG: Crp/Fnr family transcriptional regulator [Cyclobacteriaceae bacterium]